MTYFVRDRFFFLQYYMLITKLYYQHKYLIKMIYHYYTKYCRTRFYHNHILILADIGVCNFNTYIGKRVPFIRLGYLDFQIIFEKRLAIYFISS